MSKLLRASVIALLVSTLCATVVPTAPAPAPRAPTDVIVAEADRDDFVPSDRCRALPGRAVGISVSPPWRTLENWGCLSVDWVFSRDAQAYRSLLVPNGGERDQWPHEVRAGERGEWQVPFPRRTAATSDRVARWGVPAAPCLVEIEVNHGLGAPADRDSFVATHMRVVEGTREYPLRVATCLAETEKLYRKYVDDQQPQVEAVRPDVPPEPHWTAVPPSQPGKSEPLVYLTWMSEAKRLRIVYLTRIAAASWYTGVGYVYVGVELGRAYEFNRAGDLVRTLTLPPGPCHFGLITGGPCD